MYRFVGMYAHCLGILLPFFLRLVCMPPYVRASIIRSMPLRRARLHVDSVALLPLRYHRTPCVFLESHPPALSAIYD